MLRTRLSAPPLAVLFLVAFAMLVAACQGFTPETARQKLAAAEIAFTEATEAATSAYEAGYIVDGSATETAVDTAIHSIDASLEAGHAALATDDEVSAMDWGNIALNGAMELTALLNKRTEP